MSRFIEVNGQHFDLTEITIAEISQKTGVSIYTIKHIIKETESKRKLEKAKAFFTKHSL